MSVSEAVLTDIVTKLSNPSLPDISRAAKDELSKCIASVSFYKSGGGVFDSDADDKVSEYKARARSLLVINDSVLSRRVNEDPLFLSFENIDAAKFYVLNSVCRVELYDVRNDKLIEDALLHFCQNEVYELHNEAYSKIHHIKSRTDGARKLIRNWRYERKQRELMSKGIILSYGCPDFEVAFCDDENDVQMQSQDIKEIMMIYRPWGDKRFDYTPPWLVKDKVE